MRTRGFGLALAAALLASAAWAGDFAFRSEGVEWQQLSSAQSFTVFVEREELCALDRVSRMIFAVQVGKGGPKLDSMAVRWQVTQGAAKVAEGESPLSKGLLDVGFRVDGLKPGRYDIAAQFTAAGKPVGEGKAFFRIVETKAPPAKGRVGIILPRGVSAKQGRAPLTFGVPFPKGALWKPENIRVVTADGKPVPSQAVVRSRWGHTDETSIRWLGVDIQSPAAPAWWPDRKAVPYYLEYGPDAQPAAPSARVTVKDTADGLDVDTGALRFIARRGKFNMLDRVWLGGKEVAAATPQSGAYLVDHEGNVYRAANDAGATLTVEEKGELRVVLRAEGWYVKDGAKGDTVNYSLPTDKLCKFITRIEAYAGLACVRVLHTWILTFDPFTVRLRDVGMSLPAAAKRVVFGVEDGQPIAADVNAKGVYLIQHLPDRFDVESGDGKALAQGKRSAGWALIETGAGLMSLGHRETWQRFPKEFEVLPGEARLHVWPAHGRVHPEINQLTHEQINRLWFAHQGKELNLAQPWEYYFAVSQITGDPSVEVYRGAGLALAGIHASSLGAALTSDIMVGFATKGADAAAREAAEVFQAAPHALAEPKWFCDSLAAGWLHPYDPENMKDAEETIEDMMRGYWETQDACGEYGMWLYRAWHHNHLLGPSQWQLYRLYNATHHYEAFLPWMLYGRSGDPFYLTQGSSNIRLLTDVQVIHYDDPKYPHKEFHFGQKRLIGSTKHTNGFNTWGGDHAILAHLTCYNGMMLAYYLTGDLRVREVVVDEWQKTLLTRRDNPEFAGADRSTGRERDGARDVTNAMGELMDLYQMTYRPELLAYIAPKLDFFLNLFMRHWGQPMHNTLLFYGSEQARKQLLDAVADYRENNGKPKD
ncbi:MAG TPA: hypothetical protein P5137_12645, partial [Candidatus Brocadiia bacterium]|nr:hypothetical protein [Candidatus Brocadiia bacterium]